MGAFFFALDHCYLPGIVPTERRLIDRSTSFVGFTLALNFVSTGPLHTANAVQVLDLGAGAEFVAACWTYTNIGFKTKHALGHIAAVHAEILQYATELAGVGFGFFRC